MAEWNGGKMTPGHNTNTNSTNTNTNTVIPEPITLIIGGNVHKRIWIKIRVRIRDTPEKNRESPGDAMIS